MWGLEVVMWGLKGVYMGSRRGIWGLEGVYVASRKGVGVYCEA